MTFTQRKPVLSLQELCLSSSSTLTLSSCQRIEETCLTPAGLDFETERFKRGCQTLQDHLRYFIPNVLWDSLYHTVMDINYKSKDKIIDEKVIFFALLFDKVSIQKLKMPSILKESDITISLYRKSIIPKLTSLVEVDLTQVECEKIIRDCCKTCTQLEGLILPRISSQTLQFAIESCTQLRKFVFDLEEGPFTDCFREMRELVLKQLAYLENFDLMWWYGSNMFTKLNINRKLKLRSLYVSVDNHEHIPAIANHCPDLKELFIWTINNSFSGTNSSRSCDIFQKLAASSLKLSHLSVHSFQIECHDFEQFLSRKSIHITDIAIHRGVICGTPEDLLRILSKCPNLTALSLVDIWTEEESTTTDNEYSFPKLQSLSIKCSDEINIGFALAQNCLEKATQLKTFVFMLSVHHRDYEYWHKSVTYYEEKLVQLFTGCRMEPLSTVKLQCGDGPITERLARHVVNSCAAITCLEIGYLTEEAEQYFQRLGKEVKKHNLNLTVRHLESYHESDVTNIFKTTRFEEIF